MKNIFLIVFCLLVSTVWAKEEKNKRIQYCTTLEEAMQQAARKHKPIFFNCYAGWAGPSVLMDSVVLTDPDLVSFIQKHFVSLRVDMPKTQEGRKLAERYRVKFYAHYLILDEKGEIIHRISGGAKAPEFKEKLKGEDLTMAQYEELKNEISQLTETVKVLATELSNLKHPMIYNYIDKNMPEWARSAVSWAVENGILNGDENGLNLDDKDLRFITMMYRMRKQ